MMEGRGIGHGIGRLEGISLAITPGQLAAIVGPNGSGKSTLLRILAGELVPDRGAVFLEDRPLAEWPTRLLARRRAVLPQVSTLAFPMTVGALVALGRSPYLGTTDQARNREAVAHALQAADLWQLRDRLYQELSGGEQQRVHFARVLAQIWQPPPRPMPRYLLLDEPTSSLDPAQRRVIMDLVRGLTAQNIGVLAILHDIDEVARYADQALLLRAGKTLAQGTTVEVLRPANLRRAFDVEFTTVAGPAGRQMVVPA